jgi:hypothetical protein
VSCESNHAGISFCSIIESWPNRSRRRVPISRSQREFACGLRTGVAFVTWHRKGFRFFWRWKSEGGRRPIPVELQHHPGPDPTRTRRWNAPPRGWRCLVLGLRWFNFQAAWCTLDLGCGVRAPIGYALVQPAPGSRECLVDLFQLSSLIADRHLSSLDARFLILLWPTNATVI